MYQATIARVATVALAAAAFPAASASAAAHAENSASSHAGTPVAAADAVPILTAQEKNARVREAARNLHRKSAEHNSGAGSDNDTPASKAERRRRAAEESRKLSPESGTTERLSTEEVQRLVRRAKEADPDGKLPQHQWIRRMAWWDSFATFGNVIPSDYKPYDDGYANSGYEYDYWAQGYRMLGGFIDCDWRQGEGEPDGDGGGDGQRQRRNAERDLSGDNTDDACGRWMMWAAYVNPNYQGGGYNEYFGDDDGDVSALDCHSPDTEWELIGVYRQEFYQFIEQISKHLWAVDDYEYATALGGLAYMTDADCRQMGDYYGGVLPLEGGTFQMSAFEDSACLYPLSDITFDDLGGGGRRALEEAGGANEERDLSGEDDNCRRRLEQINEQRELEDGNGGNNDGGDFDCDYYDAAQEYTLTDLNEVYDTYRYCTLCIDYPTYQDGYLIGDDGMDEDDLINQCWKFHSHDSYTCNGDCMAKGSMQGSIIEVSVGSTTFGTEWEGANEVVNSDGQFVTSRHGATRLDRIKANLFLTFAGILFVATFLAFAVARGSGRERRSRSRSSKSRSLLTSDEKRRARSSSRHRSSRSKSKGRRSSSRGDGERRSKSGTRGNSRSRRDSDSPRTSSRSKSKSRSGGGRRHADDF